MTHQRNQNKTEVAAHASYQMIMYLQVVPSLIKYFKNLAARFYFSLPTETILRPWLEITVNNVWEIMMMDDRQSLQGWEVMRLVWLCTFTTVSVFLFLFYFALGRWWLNLTPAHVGQWTTSWNYNLSLGFFGGLGNGGGHSLYNSSWLLVWLLLCLPSELWHYRPASSLLVCICPSWCSMCFHKGEFILNLFQARSFSSVF